jgi:hypothetical protein
MVRGDICSVVMSGTENMTYKYAEFLRRRNYDIEMLLAYSFPLFSDKLKPDHKAIRERYRLLKSRKIKFVRVETPFSGCMLVHLRDLPDGIIYFPYTFYEYLTNVFLKRKGQAFVFGGHCFELSTNYPLLRRAMDKLFILALKLGNYSIYFHTINPEQGEYLVRMGVPESNIFYVPYPIDYKDFPLKDNTSDKLKVLHIGGTNKNSVSLIGIFDKLIEANEFDRYEFYFMGSRQPSELQEYAKKYGNIKILGFVTGEQKFNYLQKSDVLIMPGLETFSIAGLEALETGPILVTRPNPAMKKVQDLGGKLFIVEHDPDAYIAAFKKVIAIKKNAKLMRKYRLDNKRICKKYYSSEVVLPQMEGMFNAISRRHAKNR